MPFFVLPTARSLASAITKKQDRWCKPRIDNEVAEYLHMSLGDGTDLLGRTIKDYGESRMWPGYWESGMKEASMLDLAS